MFRIIAARGPRFDVRFSSDEPWGSNKVSIVTGQNGSGKTELLTALAASFDKPELDPAGVQVIWSRDGRNYNQRSGADFNTAPERVITQTFSPFTRFAAPEADADILTQIYADGQERTQRYRSIGLHRKSRYIGGVLSRNVLEQALFRLSEAPEQTAAMAGVLGEIGFHDSVHLVYRKYPEMRELLKAYQSRGLETYLQDKTSRPDTPASSPLAREAKSAGFVRLGALLAGTIELLERHRRLKSLELFFSFSEGRRAEDYAILQALALLRRLRLIRLSQCTLALSSGSGLIDLADASSGQQQLLCSILGLVAELRSNSLVLIDEPELSLHPTWQMSFLGRLGAILRQFNGCHVIVATHSPLIVQSALQQHLEVVQLRPDSAIPGAADSFLPDQKTASVEGALLDVFHTPISGSIYLANEIFEIVTEGEGGGPAERQGALTRLEQLRKLYGNQSQVFDRHSIQLIEDAIGLVEIDDDEGALDAV